MTTLPTWALLLIGAWIAISAYFIGETVGNTKSYKRGIEDGAHQGYLNGYRACIERTRDTERTKESEACDER